MYGVVGICPALFWNGEMYRCRLADDFRDKLYIGEGCFSSPWRDDVKRRTELG
jgi:hypothetical protein